MTLPRHRDGRVRALVAASASALALLIGTSIVVSSADASAIPAFARRYESSCQTCHLAFPKLTPFGEAFRRNGYRFPSGGDTTSQKEEPLPLGNEAQKDVFPDAVWPGQIPGKFPLGFMAESTVKYGSTFETHSAAGHGHDEAAAPAGEHGHEKILKFDDLGLRARMLAGGVLGDIASYFGAITFNEHGPVEVERANVQITPVNPSTLRIKVGSFEPELHGVSIHRGIMGHMLRLTTTAAAPANGFTPEMALRGLEVAGVALGRLGWAVGAVENAAPVARLGKDLYARVEGKLGGMRLDGVGHVAGSQAWRERSATIGASFYEGKTVVKQMVMAPTDPASVDDSFRRVGVDAHVTFDDVLLDVVLAQQTHTHPGDMPGAPAALDLAYAELTYVVMPWIFPTLRAEASRLTGNKQDKDWRWVGFLSINGLLRPNLLIRLDAGYGKDPDGYGVEVTEHAGFRSLSLAIAAAL